jgi:hypothetical protein
MVRCAPLMLLPTSPSVTWSLRPTAVASRPSAAGCTTVATRSHAVRLQGSNLRLQRPCLLLLLLLLLLGCGGIRWLLLSCRGSEPRAAGTRYIIPLFIYLDRNKLTDRQRGYLLSEAGLTLQAPAGLDVHSELLQPQRG